MDLGDLRIFQAVVECGGITRAAERLHRVQSNVTTRVQQLEDELGTKLFIRAGKKLHLSPSGQVLLDYAGKLLDLAGEARDALQDASPRGLLRLGAMESTAAVRLPAPLSAYHKRYPEVTLELRTGNTSGLAGLVLAGELEAALVAEPVADAPFEKIAVYDEALVMIARAGHKPIRSASDLEPATMLSFEVGCPHRLRLEEWFKRQGAMPARIIEMTSYHTILGCAVVGMGVSVIPKIVLSTFPERKRLSVHKLPKGLDRARTVLLWRKGAGSSKIRALAEVLVGRTRG
jgi:DNA-binding transcriptional LysR family regulator